MDTLTIKTPKKRISKGTSFAWRTILFNCACHSFEEVIIQLIKAINCSIQKAEQLAFEAHTKGSVTVYTGPRERCEAVAMVLEDIRLMVKVKQ